MNALAATPIHQNNHAMVTARDAEAIRSALKNSLYPGASDASVDMVLAYCTASGLDPMTKPVHLVPMSVSTGAKDARGYAIKETRDVVMPGIGLYRINAARTGAYAGCSEPEFGPTRTMAVTKDVWSDGPNGKRIKRTVEGGSIEYPEWCRVTVTRVVNGVERLFTAKEYWQENYATAGADTDAPNSMWKKRPFGQIAKCAEAQALRKAFPEAVGSQPTAEEMEGKHYIDAESVRLDTPPAAGDAGGLMPRSKERPAIEHAPAEREGPAKGETKRKPAESAPAEHAQPAEPAEAAEPAAGIDLADGPRRMLMTKAKQAGLFTEEEVLAKFPAVNIGNLNEVLAALRKLQDANDGAG